MPRHSPRGCINSGGGVAWLAHEKKKKIKKSRRRRPTKLPDHHRRVRGHQIGRRGRRRRRGGGGGGLDLGERGGDLMLWGCGSLSLSLSLYLGGSGFGGVARRGEERSGAEMAGDELVSWGCGALVRRTNATFASVGSFFAWSKACWYTSFKRTGFCTIALEGIGFFRQLQRLLPHFL